MGDTRPEFVETRLEIMQSGFTTTPTFAVTLDDGTAAPGWVTIEGSEVVLTPPGDTTEAFIRFTFRVTATEGATTASSTFVFSVFNGLTTPVPVSGDIFFYIRHEVLLGVETTFSLYEHLASMPTSAELSGINDFSGSFFFDAATGRFAIIPSAGSSGNYDVHFKFCTNSQLSCSTPTFRFKVVSELSPPFTLDVDKSGGFSTSDAIMIVRYALSIRGATLTASLTRVSHGTVTANIEGLKPSN